MNIGALNKAFTLLKSVFDSKHRTEQITAVLAQKPPFKYGDMLQPFERTFPEEQNIPSRVINDYITALKNDKRVCIQNLMILRNGKVIAECAFGMNDLAVWKNLFSESKSVTALAIGLLIDEGKLHEDDKIIDIFGKKIPPLTRLKLKDITVRHLLTMTSTIVFNEAESVTTDEWLRGFFNSAMIGQLGKTFSYNSLNSFILSAIVKEKSEDGLSQYLNKKLFVKLGIRNFFMEKNAEGIEKGGWGMYFRIEDLAKLGQLVLNRGKWKGEQLISEEWIDKMTSVQIETPDTMGYYDYGYQAWVNSKTNSFLFNGMLGQNIIGYRDNGVLIVANAGNGDMFQQNNFFKITERFMANKFSDSVKTVHKDRALLHKTIMSLPSEAIIQKKNSSIIFWKRRILPKETAMLVRCGTLKAKSGCESVGLFPTLMQMVQNNYTGGTLSVSFAICNDGISVVYTEEGNEYHFDAGFYKPKRATVSLGGEPYLISSVCGFSKDEDGTPVFILKTAFLEMPSVRTIKFFFDGTDIITAEYSETPGSVLIENTAALIVGLIKDIPLLSGAANWFDPDYIECKAQKTFEPKVAFSINKETLPENK